MLWIYNSSSSCLTRLSLPIFSVSFLFVSFLSSQPRPHHAFPYPSVYFFEKLDYLPSSKVEEGSKSSKSHQLLQEITETLTPSLNLNTVKALTLLASLLLMCRLKVLI